MFANSVGNLWQVSASIELHFPHFKTHCRKRYRLILWLCKKWWPNNLSSSLIEFGLSVEGDRDLSIMCVTQSCYNCYADRWCWRWYGASRWFGSNRWCGLMWRVQVMWGCKWFGVDLGVQVMCTVKVPQRVNRTKYIKVTVYKISVLGVVWGLLETK